MIYSTSEIPSTRAHDHVDPLSLGSAHHSEMRVAIGNQSSSNRRALRTFVLVSPPSSLAANSVKLD